MASTDLEKLVLRVEANTRQYERSMRRLVGQADRSADGVERRFQRLNRNLSNSGRQFLGQFTAAIAAVAAPAALARASLATVQYAQDLESAADRIGFSIERLQELRFAADQAGIAQRQLDLGLQRFSRRVAEAVNGQGELKATLEQYNIELVDANGNQRDINDILRDYADAIQGASSAQEALRLAFKAFDSEGAALVEILRNGSQGLAEFEQAARAAGVVLEEELVRNGAAAQRRIDELKATIGADFNRAVLENVDALTELAEVLANVAQFGVQAAAAVGSLARFLQLTEDTFTIAGSPEDLREQQAGIRALLNEVRNFQGTALDITNRGSPFNSSDSFGDSFRRRARALLGEDEVNNLGVQANQTNFDDELRGLFGRARNNQRRSLVNEEFRRLIGERLEQLDSIVTEQISRLPSTVTDTGAAGSGSGGLPPGAAETAEQRKQRLFEERDIILRTAEESAEIKNAAQELRNKLARQAELALIEEKQFLELENIKERNEEELAQVRERNEQLQEEFGSIFADGILTALLDGEDAFKDWVRRGAEQGLRNALEDLGSFIAKIFQDAFPDFASSALGGALGSAFSGFGFSSGPKKGFALGGGFSAGQVMRVGERGPEDVVFPRGGIVIPNQGNMNGGGGVNQSITVNVMGVKDAKSFMDNEGAIQRSVAAAAQEGLKDL